MKVCGMGLKRYPGVACELDERHGEWHFAETDSHTHYWQRGSSKEVQRGAPTEENPPTRKET